MLKLAFALAMVAAFALPSVIHCAQLLLMVSTALQ